MQLPKLNETRSNRDVIDMFRGYDHRLYVTKSTRSGTVKSEGETFYEMENLSSDSYPSIGPRRLRGTRGVSNEIDTATALLGGQKLAYTANGYLYYDDAPVMKLNGQEPKKLIAMGACIVVFPDMTYYNTHDPEDSGKLENTFRSSGSVTFTLCQEDGSAYASAPTASATAPTDPENLDLWLDTSGTPHVLKQYAATTGLWTALPTVYTRIQATGIGKGFADGDGVRITGIPFGIGQLYEFDGKDIILTKAEPNAIVVAGLIDEQKTTDNVTVSRRLPILDFVFESGNRLWGCRYGENAEGAFVNEIYASKLGDFKNWFCYAGISTDSYAASVGSDGPFTGAIAYHGNPLFFKRDCLHKLYGSYPSAYQIQQSTGFRGVQNGSDKSLVILNNLLYYKSDDGICVYDGSMPTDIAEAFGGVKYDSATAGAFDNKYYVSMRDRETGEYSMFVYDAERGIWHREDAVKADCFAVSDGELYYIEDGRIRCETGGGIQDEEPVRWSAETGDMGLTTPDKKYIVRMDIRLQLRIGSRLTLYIRYDDGGWEHVMTVEGNRLESFSLPVLPRRCDHFRLRIEGRGAFRLYSIAKTLETGSEAP